MDPQKITELANLLRNNGDKILNSEFTLTLSGSLLRALNDSFTLIADTGAEIGSTKTTFVVVKPNNSKSPVFRDLQLVHDFVQKTTLLCIVHYPAEDYFEGIIDISKFRALKRLEVQKTNVRQIVGIQPLRSQLQQLICVKSLTSVEDIITRCGGDNSNGFVWNELKIADFSYNNLQTVDSALEFAQYLQHLNLRHNQLCSVEAIKWLPHLKTLDLSFNRLQCVPQFHMEAYKRLQSLNMSNNFVEDLMGIAKLDALTDLDLADNCLLEHSYLLPLSALLTLKFLNLYGNPLHCHPKHRLAVAQFLHKNTATVKFILDFEPLSKSEKAITGSQQLRHVGSLNRYTTKSSAMTLSSGRLTPSSQLTPASSVGSLRSFKFHDSSTDAETSSVKLVMESSTKRRSAKIRNVEIDEVVGSTANVISDEKDAQGSSHATQSEAAKYQRRDSLSKTQALMESNDDHLEAKKHIETLRKKYGTEWLQSGNAEMMQSVLGIESSSTLENSETERNISRQQFNDFLGEFSTASITSQSNKTMDETIHSSTPKNDSLLSEGHNRLEPVVSPIKSNGNRSDETAETTLYMSMDHNNATGTSQSTNQTLYKSANECGLEEPFKADEMNTFDEALEDEHDDDDEAPHLRNVYSSVEDEEPELSEPEDDEKHYIVYTANRHEAIFLTISSNFLRERDSQTLRTKTKWSFKILESCDRIKSNMLRINFDTVKADKQERVYTVEDGLCQDLEKQLRDILSQRDLTEMNQTIYRCINCASQFSRENKYKPLNTEIRCPDCRSTFVAEIHDIPKSLEKSVIPAEKLSPAAIVMESQIATPLLVRPNEPNAESAEETNSIGSANSLNESSSCSKISNSQSSFDSNQSVVGSSNTDRDNDFKLNYESDVDILSNPSQSSIEVLDQMHYSSRKTSEERRISIQPSLETIDDHSYKQTFIDQEFSDRSSMAASSDNGHGSTVVDVSQQTPTKVKAKHLSGGGTTPLAHINLTESSSSGSVTDSVCTAYEQADKTLVPEEATRNAEKNAMQNLLSAESLIESSNHNNNNNQLDKVKEIKGAVKKEDSGLTSMFGALFQSTNMLMSSSKKLIDAEASTNIQSGTPLTTSKTKSKVSGKSSCQPYKFNYTDFNDVDHRLKLHFYQTKFKEEGEHFKWITRGRIYNENTHTLSDVGIVVVSTCKLYLMEAFAPEHDDVTKWLRQVASVTVDRLESIQLLPWKIGLSFQLRDWGGFLLLLQDILRTDSLLLYFANNSLPSQCELNYQPAEQITKRLSSAVIDEQLKMCSLLNGCEVSMDSAKRSFNISCLLTTDTHLYLTSDKLSWLSLQPYAGDSDIELCLTQLMSNLVEVERSADNVFAINFLDETQNKCELWTCTFETKENAESCLNAIGQSWELLFGVPLMNA